MSFGTLLVLLLQAAEPSVAVTLEHCGEASEASVMRILDVELRLDPSAQVEGAHLQARCDGRQLVLALQRKDGTQSQRTVQVVRSEPKVLERLIALTGAEMLSAVPSVTEANKTITATEPAPLAPPVPASWLVELSGGVRSFPMGRLSVGGVRAALLREWFPHFFAGVDAEYALGSVLTALGSVSARGWGVGAAARWQQPFASTWAIEESVGLSLGEAQLKGQTVVAALWWGPKAEVGVIWSIGPSVRLRAFVQSGFAVQGVTGDVTGEPSIGATGLWVAGGMGAGWSWN